jgi:hypothetical protein
MLHWRSQIAGYTGDRQDGYIEDACGDQYLAPVARRFADEVLSLRTQVVVGKAEVRHLSAEVPSR